ncbi:hypothetical protein DJ524_08465, partial [Sulfolobus sp. D5]
MLKLSKMISLTLVTERLGLGGGFYYYLEITNRLLKRGYDVKIVSSGGSPWFYPNNRVPIIYPKEPKLLKILSNILQIKYRQVHYFRGLDYYIILSKLLNIDFDFSRIMSSIIPESDLIITGLPSAFIWSFMSKKYKKLAFFPQGWPEYIYVLSRDIRWYLTFISPYDYYIALTGIETDLVKSTIKRDVKFFVVSAGVDTQLFKPRRRDNDDIKVMVILRPEPNKGAEVAIRTLNLLSKYLDFTAVVIDHGVLEKFRNEIRFKYEAYKPVSREKLVELYNSASVFLFTSKLEGYGLPPLEAMACGTPVVMTDNVGSRAYAVNGYNALVDDTH